MNEKLYLKFVIQ